MKMYTIAMAVGVAVIGFMNVMAKAVPRESMSRLRPPRPTSSRATTNLSAT